MVEYHLKQKDLLDVRTRSSVGVEISALFTVLHRDGRLRTYPWSDTTVATGVPQFQPTSPMPDDGIVVGLNVQPAGTIKRGQILADAFITEGATGIARTWLARGYVYSARFLGLGDFEDPLSGRGHLDWIQEANDIAGNVVTTVNLAASGRRRIVRAVIVKYHQVGGSAATITITLRDLADSGGPTNWSIESDTWVSPGLALGANQEGLIHVGEHGFLSTNDAGVLAYADNTTAPNPFPMIVEDGDPVDLLIAASGGASGDDYDVWIQYEEWIEG